MGDCIFARRVFNTERISPVMSYSVSGGMTVLSDAIVGEGYWGILITKTGTLTIDSLGTIGSWDIFLQGGGGGGGATHCYSVDGTSYYFRGSGGGGGGYQVTITNVHITSGDYSLTVGAGGDGAVNNTVAGGYGKGQGRRGATGGATKIIIGETTYTANGGTGGYPTYDVKNTNASKGGGGSGTGSGGRGCTSTSASNGAAAVVGGAGQYPFASTLAPITTLPYSSSTKDARLGAGGGGGGGRNSSYSSGANGGATGGGKGGNHGSSKASNGAMYGAGGGGGGGTSSGDMSYGKGGSGYAGCIIIRGKYK